MKHAPIGRLFFFILFLTALPTAYSAKERSLIRVPDEDRARFTREERVAVVVGVGSYPASSGFNRLDYARRDAEQLAAQLEVLGYSVLPALLDSEATKGAILEALTTLRQIVDPGQGTVIFFFAGHGFARDGINYLAPFEAGASTIKDTGLSLGLVEQHLIDTNARRRVMFIDACRNDPGSGARGAGLKSFAHYQAAEGLRILFSTKEGGKSWEYSALGHGLFSHFLLHGLRGEAGKNGLVTFEGLADYVEAGVLDWSTKHGKAQKPYQSGRDFRGDFLLARNAEAQEHHFGKRLKDLGIAYNLWPNTDNDGIALTAFKTLATILLFLLGLILFVFTFAIDLVLLLVNGTFSVTPYLWEILWNHVAVDWFWNSANGVGVTVGVLLAALLIGALT